MAIMGILFVVMTAKDDNVSLNNYIILNGENFYEYQDGQIKSISLLENDLSDQLFKVYRDYQYSGEYYLVQNSSKYQYMKFSKGRTNKYFVPQMPFIAMTDKIDYVDFEKEDLDDADRIDVRDLMSNKGINDIGNIDYSYKVNIDVDNDEENETIYVISNFDYVHISDNLFSIIYVRDGSDRRILEEYYFDSTNYEEFITCSLSYILDLNDNGLYTLVVSSSDDDQSVYNFYVKNNNYYKNLRLY